MPITFRRPEASLASPLMPPDPEAFVAGRIHPELPRQRAFIEQADTNRQASQAQTQGLGAASLQADTLPPQQEVKAQDARRVGLQQLSEREEAARRFLHEHTAGLLDAGGEQAVTAFGQLMQGGN